MTKKPRTFRFFEMFSGQETPRRCHEHPRETAVAWMFRAAESGQKDKSSRTAACRACLAAERVNL